MAKTEKAAAPADRTIEDRIDELHKRRRSAASPEGATRPSGSTIRGS
jgi:hypothetical protein